MILISGIKDSSFKAPVKPRFPIFRTLLIREVNEGNPNPLFAAPLYFLYSGLCEDPTLSAKLENVRGGNPGE